MTGSLSSTEHPTPTPAMQEHLQCLIHAVRVFDGRGWTPATSSNFSCRDVNSTTTFHISASGLDKGEMEVHDFLAQDFQPNGEVTSRDDPAGRKPSAETLLHAAVYRLYPHIGAVLHCHSVNGTVISRLYEEHGAVTFRNLEILKAFEGVRTHEAAVRLPIFGNDQDMRRLAGVVEASLSKTNEPVYGFMLAGHGLYAWGETIRQAKRHVEAFEFLFETALKLRAHGDLSWQS